MENSFPGTETALGFDEIRRRLAALCSTQKGQEHCLNAPSFLAGEERKKIFDGLRELFALEDFSLDARPLVPSLDAVFHKVQRQMLSLVELAAVVQLREAWSAVRKVLGASAPELCAFCPGRDDEALSRIALLVTPDATLREDADPELRRIASELYAQRERMLKTCYAALRADPQYFRSQEPVFRNERVLLPYSADYRAQITGILVASSESGATLYVETEELVPLNNAVVLLREQQKRRVTALREELSETVRSALPALESMQEGLCSFDLRLARLRLAQSWPEAAIPQAAEDLYLDKAINPLMPGSFVPLTLSIARERSTVIVSGPNAGGKTVSLKTLGLMMLMHHFAIPLPVSKESRIPECSKIFCIIGDSQSIDASLSTYSARLTEYATMLNGVDASSLVLVDECGSHTDPNEGGAIACAILDELRSKGARAWVTTHLGMLKAYALEHDDVASVSMEFDERSGLPTFRMHEGVPEGSHALSIAARCGVDERVIAKARGYMQSDTAGSLVERFGRRLQELEEEARALQERKDSLEEEYARMEKERQSAQEAAREDFERERALLTLFRRDASRKLDRLVEELQRRGFEALREEVKDFRKEVDETLKKQPEPRLEEVEPTFRKGEEVEFKGYTARVEEIDKAGRILLQLRGKRMWARVSDLRRADERRSQKPSVHARYETEEAQYQSDVRGLILSEAIGVVETQLQRAVSAGMHEIAVVHGKGEGVLQTGLKAYLDAHSLVKSHRYARPEDGGYGKSYALLID